MTEAELRAALHLGVLADVTRHELESLVVRLEQAVAAGITIIHLRAKHADARELAEVTRTVQRAVRCPLIVHERLDVALATGVAGAHLGRDALPIPAARPVTPAGFLLGASVAAEADVTAARAADYVLVGPYRGSEAATTAGLDAAGIHQLAEASARPCAVIGGVTPDAARTLRALGGCVRGVVVLRSVLDAADVGIAVAAYR